MDCVGTRVFLNNRKMNHSQKRKAYVTFSTASTTKVVFGLFSLLALATNIILQKYQTNPNLTYTNQVLNLFHKVNELYYGAFNEGHHFLYSTDIRSNECFAF